MVTTRDKLFIDAIKIVEESEGIKSDLWRSLVAAFVECHKDPGKCPNSGIDCFKRN